MKIKNKIRKSFFSSIIAIIMILTNIFTGISSYTVFAEPIQEESIVNEFDNTTNESNNVIDDITTTTGSSITIKEDIQVTVEGFSDTLYNEVIDYEFSKNTTPLDVLEKAVGKDNIEGTDSAYGYFITGILGENKASNAGWMYYVKDENENIILPSTGVGDFNGMTDLEGNPIIQELVFYISAYSGSNIITKIPKISVEKNGVDYKLKVVNYEVGNTPIKNVNITVGSEGTYKTNNDGEVTFSLNKAGTYNVEISKDTDYPEIVQQHLILESEGNKTQDIENIIAELTETYKDKEDLKAIEIMAYNNLMNNEDDYKLTFKLNESENAGAYAENIMGLLATNKDASYYTNLLVNSQNEEGKFVINGNDEDSITNLADSIVALDMAKASYNIEKALQALIASANDGHYEDVTTTAYALKALLKHSDITGVKEMITSSIEYLKSQQLDCGGYDYYSMGNSPYSTGPVIQTLIMSGEDLASDEWKRNNRTLVESLIACKVDGLGFEFVEGMGGGFDDPTATQYAFAALSDVYSEISMYDKFTVESVVEEKDYNELIDNAIDNIRDYLTSMETRMDSMYNEHPAFYRPLEALPLNVTSDNLTVDIEDIAEKFVRNEAEGTLPYAMNIIGLLSSGQDANKYVDLLKNGQLDDGNFKIGRVEQTEWSVIALDMAGANYDTEKAVQAIMDKSDSIDDVSILSVALTALAPHKDITGVKEFIDSKFELINSKQLETGGFNMNDMMTFEETESSIPTSYVISALVANGINPLTDQKWIKNGNTLLDALLNFKKLNYFVYNNGDYADYFYKDEATEQAFIALADLKRQKSCYTSINNNVVSNKSLITDGLFKLRNYLTTTEKRANSSLMDVDVYYSWQEALAINHSSKDLNMDYEDIQQKLKIEDNDDVLSYAENIMGLIASGQVLSKSDKDYVTELVSMQDENGQFKEEEKTSNVYKQSYSIIALDMAKTDYNVKKAVESLIAMSSNDNFGSVEETAWALIALSNHKDIEGATNIIDSSINYLNDNQSENGGFDMMGYGDTPQYTAVVIQALIANGVDPLSPEWVKENGNLVSSLIYDQLEDGTFRACEMFGDYIDLPSTERAFAALADLYSGKSMYKTIEPQLDPSEIVKNTINEVKKYYYDDQHYNYLEAMALNLVGVDKAEISSKLELREAEANRTYIVFDNDIEMLAKDIMGIIAAGENPREYNGKNYVTILNNAQMDNGEFKLEDNTSISSQAYSIIALDMADSEYDVNSAIADLLSKYEADSRKSIYSVSETIIALSNHKDISGVEEKINICIEELKTMQMESGGFDYNNGNSSSASECSEYDAIAIQALIAAGRDPLSDEFKKNGKTIVDSILDFKVNDHFIYDSQKSSYKEYIETATSMALAALIDLDNNESMYRTLTIDYSEPEDNTTLPELRKIIEETIEKSSELLMQESIINPWMAVGISRADKKVPDSYIESIDISELKKSTDIEKTILALIAIEEDPTNFDGINLIEKLCEFDLTQDSISAIVYGLIALDSGEYKIPTKTSWTRDDLINKLLEFQNEDGGWSFSGTNSDPDMTGMVMTALAPYNCDDNSKVKEAINNAVERLSSTQLSTGEHKGAFDVKGMFEMPANSNSTAQVLMGLCSNGIDPTSDRFTKNGVNVVESLLSFKSENNGFGYDDNEYDLLSTEQSLYALEQYIYFLDEKGLLFSWGDKNPIEEKAIIIENLSDKNKFELGDDAKITIKAINNSENLQTVTLIIALYNDKGEFITYTAAQQIVQVDNETVLMAMMKLPSEGQYELKCFVWNSFEDMKHLSETIIIPCK